VLSPSVVVTPGRAHDWAISSAFVRASPRPVFLAGGLTAENVGQAIDTLKPFGVDLRSGVRTCGNLDKIKLVDLVLAIRKAGGGYGRKRFIPRGAILPAAARLPAQSFQSFHSRRRPPLSVQWGPSSDLNGRASFRPPSR
jgi:hypothetical protein